jgi:hypothetical protein
MQHRSLKSVSDFAAASGFTEAQVRWWIHQAEINGLARAGALVRIQRRVYIDAERFWQWVDSGAAAGRKVAA